jgi:hypothetical protein
VDLPEVEVVGSEPPERLVQLSERDLRVTSVRADLRHQEDGIAAIGNRAAHPVFTLPIVVLPGVVEEIHTGIDGLVHDAHGFSRRTDAAQVIPAEADDGDPIGVPSERAARD